MFIVNVAFIITLGLSIDEINVIFASFERRPQIWKLDRRHKK